MREYVIPDSLVQDSPVVKREEEPSAPVEPSPPQSNGFAGNWLTVVLLAFVTVLLFTQQVDCDSIVPEPDDDVIIDESGKFALILQDESEEGQAKLSDGQAAAINSVAVKEWCQENGFAFRILDYTEDPKTMEPVWQALRDIAEAPPSLTASVEGRARTGELPDGIDATLKSLESMQ